jgi:hypothetical protein
MVHAGNKRTSSQVSQPSAHFLAYQRLKWPNAIARTSSEGFGTKLAWVPARRAASLMISRDDRLITGAQRILVLRNL